MSDDPGAGWLGRVPPSPDFSKFLYSIQEPEHRKGIKYRIIHVFQNYGITSFDQLLGMTDAELLRLNNFGRKALVVIDDALEQRNLYRAHSGKRWCPACGQIILDRCGTHS